MTPAEMPAGGEMDRMVAERVMGWTSTDCPDDMMLRDVGNRGVFRWWRIRDDCHDNDVWSPSTNIADAWRVVDQLRAKHDVRIIASQRAFLCRIIDLGIAAYGDTAPLAICRAALTACPPGRAC